MTPEDRGLALGFSFISLGLGIIIAIVLFTGCGPTWDHGWALTGAPVPAAYENEIFTAAEIIRSQEGVLHRHWGGTIVIHDAPFTCPYPLPICRTLPDGTQQCTTLCSGYTSEDGHVINVVYDPAVNLGPVAGSTAIEWEFCQAARIIVTCGSVSLFNSTCGGYDGDPEVLRCANEATPKVIAALQ